jgi:hypothetical protein
MSGKVFLLLILPIFTFADDLSKDVFNELNLYTDRPYRTEPDKSIFYELNTTSYVPDKFGHTEAYFISPINNWKSLETHSVPSYYRLSHTPTQSSPGYVVITVNAPRNNNENVAKWASAQQTAILGCDVNNTNCKVYATHSTKSTDTEPKKLNYAFIGKITLKYNKIYICKNVIVGQGHSGAYNNWWIYTNFWPTKEDGSPRKEAYKDRILCYDSKGNPQQFIVKSFSTNKFVLTQPI